MARKSLGLDRDQRLCLAFHLSMDDMQARLAVLARAGRADDCVALMQELGDWMAAGRGEVSPLMYATFDQGFGD
ncbi:MAG: hypothetical protein DBW85_01755 [Synechococcus sp. MED-G71]|nr:MAG: hypothetical protein DBW85_01755 [Synechococcus sp. MED-G71]